MASMIAVVQLRGGCSSPPTAQCTPACISPSGNDTACTKEGVQTGLVPDFGLWPVKSWYAEKISLMAAEPWQHPDLWKQHSYLLRVRVVSKWSPVCCGGSNPELKQILH
ncbi:hypothetical protein AMECASPLE_014986 [Ameca splendens]|uniref:Uncharacterized protein n=1 Tax=Ameca splendens TaxID=208324 RepID=A0ABV0XQJ8_9TELE